jgi:predicted nucleotidyltransferase
MKSLFGIQKIGIFGPFVRGVICPDSNIEIEVEFAKGAEKWQNFIGLADYLEDLFGQKVDLVTKRVLDEYLSDEIGADCIDRDRLFIEIAGVYKYVRFQQYPWPRCSYRPGCQAGQA